MGYMPPNPPTKTRRWISRLFSLAAASLVLTGVFLLLEPYNSDVQAKQSQQSLSVALQTPEVKEAFEERNVPPASPVSRLLIPRLGVNTVVVEGTEKAHLDAGAGHYSNSPLPGEEGNIAIAGHRTTYGKPFHDLDQLAPGDQVVLETPVGNFVYEMVDAFDGHANPWIIEPDDWSVVAATPTPSLTLTTCHPKRSARQRLVARLALVQAPE